ncbi:PA14 domain-containing protein [uncultured Pontibacter sp.]|uniref:PA14 domain-containing protein n=1 Tax=uncultured Pontibacter sp. TaxID=453356 RepID=UPI002627A4D1|nr:PA14 domain-containing protein [uncultured Pontibacter sp.]
MNTRISNLSKKTGRAIAAQLFVYILFVLLPSTVTAQTYSGPLVITKGGTYKGNWESKDSEVAAVEIKTSEPVIIENSNIRGAGPLIRSLGNKINLTVRHTNGYGITPTPYKDYKKARRFLGIDVFKNVVVENCYMENTAGIYIGQSYEGNGSSSETIKIRYNIAKNIDGRVYGGTTFAQFVQFNFRNNISHAEVAWNQVINAPNNSAVEDNINIHNSRGTKSSPIRIHNNYIEGAFPMPAESKNYSGGGIITDGDGDINTCPAYIEAHDNQLIGLGNYSMGIAGGNNIRYHHNRAVNAATFENGAKYGMYTSGLWSNDYYKKNTTFSNSVDNNVVGIVAWGYVNNRNDISVADFASFASNSFLPNPISKQTEKSEFSNWQSKLSKNGIVLGPNGSAGSTPANQAPAVAITSPTANTAIAQGASVVIEANATDNDGSITKVEFFQGTVKLGEDASAPFAYTWNNASVGTYSLTAKAHDNAGGSKTSSAVAITVAEQTADKPSFADAQLPVANTGNSSNGSLTLEVWANVDGHSISDIPVSQKPTNTKELTLFEAPSNVGDNYGQRISGYITAPESGQYTFWIAGDNNAELWVSTSDAPAAKKKLAYVNGWTKPREWNKYSSQQSAKVTLEAGKRYYIEALSKEEAGGDNLSVGWQLPNGAKELPIAGDRFTAPSTTTPVSAPIAATGKIILEHWKGVKSENVNAIPVSQKPTSTKELTLFEAPSNVGDNYAQRIHGYITAPESGQYIFWIAGDNHAELSVSTSEDPAAKKKVAFVNGWTNPREWNKYSSQQSVKITLEAGKRYYIEALHLEGAGGDNVAVGWQLPSGAKEMPIAGNRLSPFGDAFESISAMKVSEVADSDPFFAQTTAYPNPFRDVVTLAFGDNNVELAEVTVLDQTGRIVYKESKLELVNNQLSINLADLKTGLYILKYTDKAGKTDSIKIVKE